MEYIVVNGWKIYFHDCFLKQHAELAAKVEKLALAKPAEYKSKRETKHLAGITRVIVDKVAADPLNPAYRHGGAIGGGYRHWLRVKFGHQYRLFYRCSEEHKAIVIGWMNDEDTLRAYGSKTDAYNTFAKMLKAGDPPDDWDELLGQAKENTAASNIKNFF